jgi:hypothetical protein
MTEQEMLEKMIAPGQIRPSKPYRGGVIQIHVTRACDRACYSCTQGSQLGGKPEFMPPDLFEEAVLSLKNYFGVIGTFGGNPCMSPHFVEYCEILRRHIPREQRGLWSNDLLKEENGRAARETFNPGYSNLNVHMSREAADRFRRWWPEAGIVGLDKDSRHSPCYVAMRDVLRRQCTGCGGRGFLKLSDLIKADSSDESEFAIEVVQDDMGECPTCRGSGTVYDEERARPLIATCDINQFWSASIGMFRGQLRGYFCEIAMAQSILHQHEPDYPDTGYHVDRLYDDGEKRWWQLPMHSFANQVRKHCHDCGVPLRGMGQLAVGPESQSEQVSGTHVGIYKTKRRRPLEMVTTVEQLGVPLERMTKYLQNSGVK